MRHRPPIDRLAWRATAALAALLLTAATAGCDSTPYPTGEDFTTTVGVGPDGAPTTSLPPNPAPVVVDIDIAGGSVQPQNTILRAAVGQPIELHVDSDSVATIDVDAAADRNFAVKPIEGQVFDFTVNDPGTVTIATRDPAQTVATIEVGAQQAR